MTKINIVLQVKPSLRLDLRNGYLISYETKVAKVDFTNKTIKVFGKYSRTTTKHISETIWRFGLSEIDKGNKLKKVVFYKYDLGCYEQSKNKIDLSQKLSDIFIDAWKKYNSMGIALYLTQQSTTKRSSQYRDTIMEAIRSLGFNLKDEKVIKAIVQDIIRNGA